MQNYQIIIREANQSDCQAILDWRNDPESMSMSLQAGLISIKEHKIWFSKSLSNPNRQLFIGELENDLIGLIRFDMYDDTTRAEVSININPLYRGRGVGKKFLKESVDKYLSDNQVILTAKIKDVNIASRKIFESAGFDISSKNHNTLYLERNCKR